MVTIESKPTKLIERMDFQIALAIALCMLLSHFWHGLQLLSACTAALMCSQDTAKISIKSSATRLLTTLVGGIVGIAVVLVDGIAENTWLVMLLCALGAVLTLLGCRLCRVPPIAGRIGCVTFILVVVVAPGATRILYAGHRVVATLCGAAIAIAITWLFNLCRRSAKVSVQVK